MGLFNKDEPEVTEETEVKVPTTKRKTKELNILKVDNSPFYRFEFTSNKSLELPEKLKGSFTSMHVAEEFRDSYYAGNLNKE